MDDEEQVLLELTYPEITSIGCVKPELQISGVRPHAIQFNLQTIRGDFTFRSSNAEDIQELIAFFLDGLKRRSKYCVAIQDYKVNDGEIVLKLRANCSKIPSIFSPFRILRKSQVEKQILRLQSTKQSSQLTQFFIFGEDEVMCQRVLCHARVP